MSEPLAALQRQSSLQGRKSQPHRPTQLAKPNRPQARDSQPVVHQHPSAAVLESPVNSTLSITKTDDGTEFSLILDTDFFQPDSATRSPGFSSYDEAEAARCRLPVQSLDLVPSILSRSGTPVMLSAQLWLDPMLSYTPGWYESMSSIDQVGQELAACTHVKRADGSGRKYFAFVRDLWAIHEDESQKVWHASYLNVDERAGLDDPIGRGFFAGGGPSWPVDSRVTLLAKAIDARGEFFVKSYPTSVAGEESED